MTGREKGKPFISIRDLSYVYGEGGNSPRPALDGVSADIFPGDFVAVIGANGSGKSTLARHLNAILAPGSGKVLVDGLDTSRRENVWEIRSRVGMVFQNPDNQAVAATVEEDVAFGPENLGIQPAEVRRRVNDVLARVGLDKMAGRPPHTLSGGQKQLLAIAGVLAMRPRCIVLDEPTAMLDPRGRRKIMDLLVKINREQGITVVLITHFMEEAIIAGRVWGMYRGKLALDGNAGEIFSREECLRRLGLEMPPVRQLVFLLREGGLCLPESKKILSLDGLMDKLTYVL